MSVWPDLTEITGGKTNPQRTMTLTKFSKIMKIFNFDEFFFFPDLAEMGIKFETDCLRTTDSDHMWMLLGLNHFWCLNVQLVIRVRSVPKNFFTFFEGGGVRWGVGVQSWMRAVNNEHSVEEVGLSKKA